MNVSIVRRAFMDKKKYEADAAFLRAHAHAMEDDRQLGILTLRLDLIHQWLLWLDHTDTEESFVIREHLIDKKSWKQIADEYALLHGTEKSVDRRTLQRRQQKGIGRIADMMDCYGGIMDHLFDPE